MAKLSSVPRPIKIGQMAALVYASQALDDLDRLEDFLLEANAPVMQQAFPLIVSMVETLCQHSSIGRRDRGQLRELATSHGKTGHIAPCRYNEIRDVAIVFATRHRREAGL